jgi:antitoxin (DNA-binding transcriptional repressor) of toxin-antitoxin stability system
VITRHNKPVARIVPVRRSTRATRSARERERALAVLAGFEPIDVPGASIEELIRSGRR